MNFFVKIIPSKFTKFKANSLKEKKDMAKSVQKARLDDTNYDLESNDSRNVLSRCRLKLRDFFGKLYKKLFHTIDTFYLSIWLF